MGGARRGNGVGSATYCPWRPQGPLSLRSRSWPGREIGVSDLALASSEFDRKGAKSGDSEKRGTMLTMSVVVMTLAIPKPCGTMSNHRWNGAEVSSHIATREAAKTVRRHENSVRLYSLPVRRMTLIEGRCQSCAARGCPAIAAVRKGDSMPPPHSPSGKYAPGGNSDLDPWAGSERQAHRYLSS